MKITSITTACIALLLALCACAPSSGAPTEAEALTLLESTQQVALRLSRCPPQPAQGDEAAHLLREAYGDGAATVWSSFFESSPAETLPGQTPQYAEGLFFPLIFHQGIELAKVELAEDGSALYIWESYSGDDPLLQEFTRAHVFVRDEGGEWMFARFKGTVFLRDPALNPVYLPIKTEYAFL